MSNNDNASIYFGLTMLGLYLGPASFCMFRRCQAHRSRLSKLNGSGDDVAAASGKKPVAAKRAAPVLCTSGFRCFSIVNLVVAVIFAVLLMMAMSQPPTIERFDPYAVSEVT